MELDELKAAWTALDNRLKRNEELNESIIMEMIQVRAGKKVNWFIALEMINVIAVFLTLPLIVYLFDRQGGKYPVLDLFFLFMAVICLIYPCWGVYKLHGLMKFNISENIGKNIFCMNRYNIQLKREKRSFNFVYPVIVIFGVYIYASRNATLPLWAFMICVLILGGFISYWSYKKYDKSIDSILRSLDEIRELKESV